MATENPPKLPLKFRVLVGLHSLASYVSRRSNFALNRRFMNLFDPKIPPSSKPRHRVSTRDVVFHSDSTTRNNLWFRLFLPDYSSASDNLTPPLLVYYHGGGFVFFSANSMPYDDLCRRLARDLPAVVVSVNYRLAPEHPFPCPYEDGFEALKFLDRLGSDSDVFPGKPDFSRCFVAGDSAGGNLAHHVALRAGDCHFNMLRIKGLIAIQPFFGGEERVESEIQFSKSPMLNLEQADWYWKAFLPNGSDRNHAAAHVFGPGAGDISAVKFPATLLIVGGRDQLRDWGRKYYEWLKGAGKEVDLVEYPNAIHGFYAVPELADASLLIKNVSDFMQKQTAV